MLERTKSIYKRHRFKLRLLTRKSEQPFDCAFVIGQNKTGTTSTHHFLRSLGLRHLTINEVVKARYFEGDLEYLDRLTRHFHSFDDNPWNRLDVIERYMRQEADFRFILTLRDPDEWFDSLVRFNRRRGRPVPEEAERQGRIEERLIHHNRECRRLAEAHRKPLLEVDVTRDADAPARIIEFLGLTPTTSPAFPHSNRTR